MYHKGDVVLIHGLKSKVAWNGKRGRVIGEFQWQQGRYPIQIIHNNDEQKSNKDMNALLKPSNLKVKYLI